MTTIRKYEEERDFSHIITLCTAEHWIKYYGEKKEAFRTALAVSQTYTAYDNGELCGFARFITDGCFTLYCCEIIVKEACRRRGIGGALLSAAAAAYPSCCTDVISDNNEFYVASGFRLCGGGLRKM